MRYIANSATMVIHDRQGSEERCNRDALEHGKDISLEDMEELLRRRRNPYSLCRYCFADDRFGQWVTSPALSDSVTSSPDSHS